MSFTTCSRMPGRCTFTATTRPLRSTARWTCPSEAAATGVFSNSAKAFDIFTPSSEVTMASTSANGNGSTSSCRRVSASRKGAGSRSARVDRSWPTLT